MPRLLGPRECFICRKGRRHWHFDYEQVEMRFYVHFSGDRKMASRLSTDLHRHTAADMYGKELEDIKFASTKISFTMKQRNIH